MPSRKRELPALLLLAVVVTGVMQSSVTGRLQLPFFGLRFIAFAINALFAMAPLALLALFLGWRRTGVLALPLTLLLGLANRLKIHELREPLSPLDFQKLQLSSVVLSYLDTHQAAIALVLLAMGAAAWLWRRTALPADQARFASRRLLALTAPALLALPLVLECLGLIQLINPRLEYMSWKPLLMATDHGYLFSQAMQARFNRVRTPGTYSSSTVQQILAPYQSAGPSRPMTAAATQRRDVVLILLESFKDYSAQIPFTTDLIPHYHRLLREGASGVFVSPSYGGNTANAEYEVLTGMRVGFLPPGAVPYAQYVRGKLPSVVGRFNKNGFSTLAIHNNVRSFWSRDHVYPLMGFERFIDSDDLADRTQPDGPVFAKSLELLREPKRARPQFQFLLTIGTHGPYTHPSNQTRLHALVTDDLELAAQVQNYAEKIHRLDDDLGAYFAELRKLPNPPVVVLFSDHQPSFELSRIDSEPDDKHHEVEVIVWNDPRLGGALKGRHALACLSPLLLKAGDLPLTPYFRFVDDVCRTHPELSATDLAFWDEGPASEYRVLSYDRLFGERHSVQR